MAQKFKYPVVRLCCPWCGADLVAGKDYCSPQHKHEYESRYEDSYDAGEGGCGYAPDSPFDVQGRL